mmetsp:Transcript_11539/g.22102  ORF Transcript_11539/g.22102 Transcript_11539/m.22102 type:complete len:134 (+) Transcript_11539:77-478(+)
MGVDQTSTCCILHERSKVRRCVVLCTSSNITFRVKNDIQPTIDRSTDDSMDSNPNSHTQKNSPHRYTIYRNANANYKNQPVGSFFIAVPRSTHHHALIMHVFNSEWEFVYCVKQSIKQSPVPQHPRIPFFELI